MTAEANYEPASQLEIDNLEALRITADRLRLRLIDILRARPATVKELAAILELSPKSLYYHVNLLEKHNLIRVVETRLVSGITEKRYRATAYLFIFPNVTAGNQNGEAGQGAPAVEDYLSHILAITNEEIHETIAVGRVDLTDEDAPPDRSLHWDWNLMHLLPEEAAKFSARLEALVAEYIAADGTIAPEGTQTFRLFSTFYPTYYRGARLEADTEGTGDGR